MTALKDKLSHREPQIIDDQNVVYAAVTVPIVSMDGEDHILFTVRRKTLRRQPGKLVSQADIVKLMIRLVQMLAIRECSEELGIPVRSIELLGPLDCLVSAIGVRLHAVAVRLHTLDFHPSEHEVGEIFTVPLKELLAMEPIEARVEVATKPMEGFPFHLLKDYEIDWKTRQSYPVYFYPYKGYPIWGLTARVLKNFLDIYRGDL
ncbi:MAG: CoA pyrophosphatase [Veillonella sp.]|nr:CoA pyrophosphatase [Veillonella sp.]